MTMTTTRRSITADASRQPVLQVDLIELETFVAVADLGSFSLAAHQLHVTQPTVTGRVKRLEASLGTRLLQRTTRKVETTPQGAELLDQANVALDGLRDVVSRFREQARLARQLVVVAATPMLAAVALPPVIHAYSLRHPDVKVRLRDLRYPSVVAALASGAADVAVLAFEGKDDRFRVQPLFSEDMVLAVPAGHALAGRRSITIETMTTYPLISLEQYAPMVAGIEDRLRRSGLGMAAPTMVGELNTLLGMLQAGIGPALLPRSMASRSKPSGQSILEIEGIALKRNFSLVTAQKAKPSTATQSFCRFLRQEMTV